MSQHDSDATGLGSSGDGQAVTARRFYDRISGVYDALADASEHGARELGIRLLAPVGAQRLLEIGFGTGHALVEVAARLGDSGRIYGVDISPGMLEVARARVADAGCGARIGGFVLGDAAALPWADGVFDGVFLSFTLELFPEPAIGEVLREVRRVLRPGGRVGIVSMYDDGGTALAVDVYRYLHRHFPHIVDCRPIDAEAFLERAGYEVVADESLSIWGLPVLAIVGRSPDGKS